MLRMSCLLAAVGLAALAGLAWSNDVYDQVAPSTVLFYNVAPNAQGQDVLQSLASGVLVDADKKLVVTAEHVVHQAIRNGSLKTAVIFPVVDKSGKINTNAVVYVKKRKDLAIPGDIIYFNRPKDVAVIRLDHVPVGARAMPLASADAEPGDKVHVVGNSTFLDGGAFDYCQGTVRNQFYISTPRVVIAGYPLRDYVFFTLCHDIPTNEGDSGGPVANDKNQLLAIVSQGTTGGAGETTQVVDKSVHAREIRMALDGMQQPGGNTLELNASVDRIGFDSFFVPVKKGGQLSAVLKGQGTTDLDLFAKDIDSFINVNFGNQIYRDYKTMVLSNGPTDQEQGSFTPDWTGVALVQVQNVGGQNTNVNQYSLVINWSDRVTAPLVFIRQIAAKGSDTFKLAYEPGKGKARVTVRSDGQTGLEMEVLDPGGASVGKTQVSSGYHDMHSITWDPAVSGSYSVQIRNVGGAQSEYVFTTD